MIRLHLGTRPLKGALPSERGKGISFAKIREAAEATRRKDRRLRFAPVDARDAAGDNPAFNDAVRRSGK